MHFLWPCDDLKILDAVVNEPSSFYVPLTLRADCHKTWIIHKKLTAPISPVFGNSNWNPIPLPNLQRQLVKERTCQIANLEVRMIYLVSVFQEPLGCSFLVNLKHGNYPGSIISRLSVKLTKLPLMMRDAVSLFKKHLLWHLLLVRIGKLTYKF